MASDKAFIFLIYIPWVKTLYLVPKSRSSVKVKYEGHSLRKNGNCRGIHVSQTHLVSFSICNLKRFCCLMKSEDIFNAGPLSFCHTIPRKKAFENILGKPENTCNNHFVYLPK